MSGKQPAAATSEAYYKWDIDSQEFPKEFLDRIWLESEIESQNHVRSPNAFSPPDNHIETISNERNGAGCLVVLCETGFDSLERLNRHVQLVHSVPEGLLDLPEAKGLPEAFEDEPPRQHRHTDADF